MYGVRCTLFPDRDKQITPVEWAIFGFMVYRPRGGLGVLPTFDTFYALTVYFTVYSGPSKVVPWHVLANYFMSKMDRQSTGSSGAYLMYYPCQELVWVCGRHMAQMLMSFAPALMLRASELMPAVRDCLG